MSAVCPDSGVGASPDLPSRPLPTLPYATSRLSGLNPDAAGEKAKAPGEDSGAAAGPRSVSPDAQSGAWPADGTGCGSCLFCSSAVRCRARYPRLLIRRRGEYHRAGRVVVGTELFDEPTNISRVGVSCPSNPSHGLPRPPGNCPAPCGPHPCGRVFLSSR